MKTYSKLDIAYLAGLFDGEGCIFISINQEPKYKHSYYSLMVHLSNTDPYLINWIGDTFGGRIARSKPGTGGKRKVWIWWTRSQKAGRILKLITPYLKCKKAQAEIALEMQKTFNKFGGSKKLSQKVLDFRSKCKADISALNHQIYPEFIPMATASPSARQP